MGVWVGGGGGGEVSTVKYGESDWVRFRVEIAEQLTVCSACGHMHLGCSSCVACDEVGLGLIFFLEWGEMKEKTYCTDPFRKHRSKFCAEFKEHPVHWSNQWMTQELKGYTALCFMPKGSFKRPKLSANAGWKSHYIVQPVQWTDVHCILSERPRQRINRFFQTVIEQVTEMEASQIVTDVLDSVQETPVRSGKFLCD